MKFSRIVFFNNCHNGDIHYSREFVKYIAKQVSVPCSVSHFKCPSLLLDTDIPHTPIDLWGIHQKSIHLENDILYLNTWIGQDGGWMHPTGVTLKSNYRMFIHHASLLGVSLLPEINYIPSIDYSRYDLSKIAVRQSRNIFVSNGNVLSSQAKNFDIDSIVLRLAKKHTNCDFYVTKNISTELTNIFDANKLTNLGYGGNRSNLNELSFLSTKCDVIVGRGSGPFCFAGVKTNMFDSKKTIMAFGNNERESHWVLLSDYEGILGARQLWRECHVQKNDAHESLVYADIDAEITSKYGSS